MLLAARCVSAAQSSSASGAQTPVISGAGSQGPAVAKARDQIAGQIQDQVHDFAEKIAAALSASSVPESPLALSFTNLASLDADEVSAISETLKSELVARKIRIADSAVADADVRVAFSKGTDGDLLIAEVGHGTSQQVIVLPLSVSEETAHQAQGIVLDTKFVWQQPGEVLDFALLPPWGKPPSTLAILEPEHLVFYTQAQGNWKIARNVEIEGARPRLRDLRGQVDVTSYPLPLGVFAILGETECTGDYEHLETVSCRDLALAGGVTSIEGDPGKLAELGGEVVLLRFRCDGKNIVLATGDGDWTRTDFVQAYESDSASQQHYIASGNQTPFRGPVVSFHSGVGDDHTARVVVHNLQTGNYEAYVVTATCGD